MSEIEQVSWLPHPTTRPRDQNAPPTPAWSPQAFHVLSKPTGAICNLGCSYCFFLDKELLYEDSRFHMSDETLEAYIRTRLSSRCDAPVLNVLCSVQFLKRSRSCNNASGAL